MAWALGSKQSPARTVWRTSIFPVDATEVAGLGGRAVPWVTDWITIAACREQDPDSLFVQGAAQNRAKTVCGGCPVRVECLADALDNRTEFGVWGGMTERERRALLRRRPEVTSWTNLLASARERYEEDGNAAEDQKAAPRRGRVSA